MLIQNESTFAIIPRRVIRLFIIALGAAIKIALHTNMEEVVLVFERDILHQTEEVTKQGWNLV